jgi:hypothetical protein
MLWGCLPPAQIGNLDQIKFITVGSIPVVEGRINGKKAFFVVDTGASISILDEACAKRFGFTAIASLDRIVIGLGGESRINDASNCLVELGPLKIDQVSFRTKRLGSFVAAIRRDAHIEVSGIIGADVFNHYKININYKDRTIIF